MKAKKTRGLNLLRFARNERGAAMAELAILVPLLALMLAAVSEFGRYFQKYTTMTKATRSAARYLSSHPFTDTEKDKARNLVVCGKTTACASGEELLPGLAVANVCIESTGSPTIETVTVRIPRDPADTCGATLAFQPLFNIGALLGTSFNFAPKISPRTTMRYVTN
ncbi:MAG TPA: TadE family protein [Pyrinomonadaceae bacterium]|jgi:Flp pilus assembly pilin Flp